MGKGISIEIKGGEPGVVRLLAFKSRSPSSRRSLRRFISFVLDAIPGNQDFFPQMDSQRMNRFMKSALNRWQRFAIALGVSAMVVVVGCGGDESGLGRRYKVTGKVTYNGAPVPHGTVNFLPTKPPPPEGRAATGEIKDGFYSLSTTGNDDGALPGDYNIAIVAMDIDLASAASSKAEGGRIHEGDASLPEGR